MYILDFNRCKSRLFIVCFLLVTQVACGGGSTSSISDERGNSDVSEDSLENPSPLTPVDQDNLDMSSALDPDDAVQNSNPDSDSPGAETSTNSSSSSNEGSSAVELMGIADLEPAEFSGQSEFNLLARLGDHPPGRPDSELAEIASVVTHPSGQLAMLGVFNTSNRDRESGVWRLKNNELELAVDEDTNIEGLSEDESISGFSGLSVGSDGSVLTTLNTVIRDNTFGLINGPSSVFLITDTELKILHTIGDTLSDGVFTQPIDGFTQYSRSGSGYAFIALSGSRSALWAGDEQGEWLVAASQFNDLGFHPVVDDCRVSYRNGDMRHLDSGDVIFEADIGNGANGEECVGFGNGIFIASREGIETIVRVGDPVPDSTGLTINSLSATEIYSDGTIIVRMVFDDRELIPFGQTREERVAYWYYPRVGSPRLMFLEGETVERQDGSLVLDLGNVDVEGTSTINFIANANKLGQSTIFIDTFESSTNISRTSIFAGSAYLEIPYESLFQPAASSQSLIAAEFSRAELPGSLLPAPFTEDDLISTLFFPEMVGDQEVAFFAELTSKVTGLSKGTYLLKRDFDGSLESIIAPIDRVASNGRDVLIMNNILNQSAIHSFDNGRLVVGAGLSGSEFDIGMGLLLVNPR